MRVLICDLTGRLPHRLRQDLIGELTSLRATLPPVDTAEVTVEPAACGVHVELVLRSEHRQVTRLEEAGPTVEEALSRTQTRLATRHASPAPCPC